MRSSIRRALLLAGLAASAGACTTWRALPTPAPTVQRTLEGPVRVTRADQYAIVLDPAEVIGDSIFGVSKPGRKRVAIALADVLRVEQYREDVIGTLLIAAVTFAAAYGAYVYAVISTSE
jgi:hypothetical protein